jgi:hypothetical protein
MTVQATHRKIKRSFTLSPEALNFLTKTRQQRKIASDSEALDLLLRESMLPAKRLEADAACKEYYDGAPDGELFEQGRWAELAGPNMFVGVPD